MKKVFLFLLPLLQSLSVLNAQSSKLSLKSQQVSAFYEEISKSTLIIPITNNKDPEEKALIDALKKYWTICPYKTISRKVFDEQMAKHEAPTPKIYYLVKETYERLRHRKKDWAYTKYYISKQKNWVEEQDEPFIEFKLPLKTINREPSEVLVGYLFGLMIKHFNTELQWMKNQEVYEKLANRKKLLKANFKHSLKPYANKTLLITKNELENYMINLPDNKKNTEKQEARFIKSIVKKTKINRKNIKVVSETDIKNVINKNDVNSLIYTGYSIYNVQDAVMLRRIDPNRGARPAHWVLATTIVIAVIITATYATGIL